MSYEQTRAKLAAALKQKLTSFEQVRDAIQGALGDSGVRIRQGTLQDYCDIYYGTNPFYWNMGDGAQIGSTASFNETNFWWYREMYRLSLGVYPQRTQVMSSIIDSFGLQQYCLHPSTDIDTPEAVAYTPDANMGANDRQLKLSSLGKFLRKYCLLVSDAHIQKLEAMHRAELDPTFSLATTPEDIEYVYQNMDGDSGCMRYDGGRWDLPAGMHPSHVYAAPGMGVAYHKVGDEIKSRAVVWTTPEGNKHWLRIYGDNALRRKLERNGYTEASLAGAKITAVRKGDYYVVPYIDGVGGNQGNSDGTYGYIDMQDPDHIQLVSAEMERKLRAAGMACTQFKAHQSVKHSVPTYDLSNMRSVCPVTGITIDRIQGDKAMLVWLNGKLQQVVDCNNLRMRFADSVSYGIGGVYAVRYDSKVESPPTFVMEKSYTRYLDVPEVRRAKGFVQLSNVRYPGVQWALAKDVTDHQGEKVRTTDMIRIVDAQGVTVKCHVQDVKPAKLRKEGYVATGVVDKIKTLVHKDHPELVQLDNGKYALSTLHPVTQVSDGTWVPTSQVEYATVCSVQYTVRRGTSLPLTLDTAPAVGRLLHTRALANDKAVRMYVERNPHKDVETLMADVTGTASSRLRAMLAKGVGGTHPVLMTGDNGTVLRYGYYYDGFDSVDKVAAVYEFLCSVDDAHIADNLGVGKVNSFRIWQRIAGAMLDAYRALPEMVRTAKEAFDAEQLAADPVTF